jgi:hypothetical protein
VLANAITNVIRFIFEMNLVVRVISSGFMITVRYV